MIAHGARAIVCATLTIGTALACGGSTGGGAFACGDGGTCPAGQTCNANGACVPVGSGGIGGAGGGVGGVGGGVGGVGGNVGGGGGSIAGAGGTAGSVSDPVAPGAQPPADPGLSPSPSAQLTVLAVSRVLLGETDASGVTDPTAWKSFGYNLDGIISTKGGVNHCKPVEGASPASVKSDGNNGIDNSFGANLIPIFQALAAEPSKAVSATIASGEWTLLWRLTNYNVGVDDSGISAWSYVGADRGAPPLWNGTDAWPVAYESVVGGNINQPKVATDAAYVAGGTLVIELPALEVPLSFQGFPMKMNLGHVVLSAQISGVGPTAAATNGVIAGVLQTEQFIAELKKVIGAFDPALCSSTTFDSIAMQMRQASDIMSDGSNGDPSVTCNAISVGLGFDAAAVTLGGVAAPVPPPPDPCAGS